MMFSGKSKNKQWNRKKISSSGASCDGVAIGLYRALVAIFASPSSCIKIYGYGFDNMVSTKIHSLDHSANCDNKIQVSERIEKSILIYADVQSEIKPIFCMFEAAYTVPALKKATYITMSFFSQKIQDY